MRRRPKSAAARRLFRVHGALAHTIVAISAWIAAAFDGASASVVVNPVGIPVPPDPGPRAPVRRRSGPARTDRHRRSPQAPGCRDRSRPALRDRGLEAELTLFGVEADRTYAAELGIRCETSIWSGQAHCGPTSDVAARLLAADALLLPAGRSRRSSSLEAMALRTPGLQRAWAASPTSSPTR